MTTPTHWWFLPNISWILSTFSLLHGAGVAQPPRDSCYSPCIHHSFSWISHLQLGCHDHLLGEPLGPWKHRYSCSWGHSLKLFPFTWLQCIALPPPDTKPVHDPPFLRGQQQGLNRVKKETIFPVFTILIDFSFHLFPFGALRLQMFKWL